MSGYVSFLRGINVGGHKVIKMEELRKIYESLKFKNVSTFIASGNVIFDFAEKDPDKVNKKIEKGLLNTLGFEVTSFLRSAEEMHEIVKKNPFKTTEISKEVKIYLTFLAEFPSAEKQEIIEPLSYEAEKFRFSARELYILLERKKLKDKAIFSTNFLEKKIKIAATTRDWNTIIKITNLLQ